MVDGMDSIGTTITLGALVAGLIALAAVTDRRHKRLRMRLERAGKREGEILHLLKAWYVRRAEALVAGAGRTPRMPIEFRSQTGEDLFLHELLAEERPGGRLDGFFIEVGGYDGYTFAATYALESMGWTGLVVEPVPELYESCLRRRPGSRVVRAALSRRGSSGTARFAHVSGSGRRYDALSHLVEKAEGPTKRVPKAGVTMIEAPLTTMDDLLREHQGPIDVAVIDVEGGELDLLDGFDVDRFRPRLLLVEDHRQGVSPLARWLDSKGYEHAAWVAHNRLFIRRDEPALLERARRLAQHSGDAT